MGNGSGAILSKLPAPILDSTLAVLVRPPLLCRCGVTSGHCATSVGLCRAERHNPEANFFGYNHFEARRPDNQPVEHWTLSREPGLSLCEMVGDSG